jgi:hypothetical protein
MTMNLNLKLKMNLNFLAMPRDEPWISFKASATKTKQPLSFARKMYGTFARTVTKTQTFA